MNTEEYIIDESQEVSLGERPWSEKIVSAFPAFKHRNYQLYFIGQLVSLIGTWLQMVAEGWLVLTLTHSAFLVGVVTALGTIPVLLFSLFGGVIVDRFEKKKILLWTQTLSMILALIYGLLTVFHFITIFEIGLLAFLLGIVNALDFPARQAYIVEVVGKEDLASAIALNSGMFNGARVIGPGVAGILIAIVGSGGAFILNGLSYIAAIIAIYLMKVITITPKTHPHPLTAIKEGLHYSFSQKGIALLMIIAGILSIFGWSYGTIMPIYVDHVFHGSASTLGYLYSASGIGALLGSIVISIYAKKVKPIQFILCGNFLFAMAVVLFTLAPTFFLALPFLFLSGFGLLIEFATMNTTLQHAVTDAIRGRVLSIYTLMFLGLAPLGSLQIGFFGEHLGPQTAIRIGAVIVFLCGIMLFFLRHHIEGLRQDMH